MKKLSLIPLLILISAFLLFSGCGKDDNDAITGIPEVTPEDYDWNINILDSTFFHSDSEFLVLAHWLHENSAITADDVFTIDVDGETHELEGSLFLGHWSFAAWVEMTPDAQYDLIFKKNGNTVAAKSLRLPHRADVTFPANFDPNEAASLNWQMAGDNEYQIASLTANHFETEEDERYEAISTSARSFTFPANAVENFGPGTEYYLRLMQMNFEKSGRVAFIGVSWGSWNYGSKLPDKFEISKLYKIVKKLNQMVQ